MTNTKSKKPIADDAVVCRLYARGTWKLRSAAHFGGDETGIADMCLLRDAKGNPFIPGASIAGAARSYLARKRMSWENYSHDDGIKNEPTILRRLFGGADTDDTMSALIVTDAACVSKEIKTSIRDGVRIVSESGTAAEGAKFDVEVLERGTEFMLNFECVIREGDNKLGLTELFLGMLYGFEQAEIALGARTRRGYGKGKVQSWEIYDLQMDNPQHVLAWLKNKPELQDQSQLEPCPLLSDQRNYFRIEADFQLHTSLLIRSSSGDPKDPDVVHLHSNDKPVIPGTSFAGAFRQRAALIANAIGWQKHGKDEDSVCEMFGPIHKQDREVKQQTDLWASRVTIEERLVKKVDPIWQDRVAIDRFTGGSLKSALFNEKPVYPCLLKDVVHTNVRLRLTLEEPEEAEIGLLLLTLRDFWYGNVPVGGETSNGRGTLQGIKAKLIYKDDPDPSKKMIWHLESDCKKMKIADGDKGCLQSYVCAAQNYMERPNASRRPEPDKSENNDVK